MGNEQTMNTKHIIHFLRQVAANNNREWFAEHKQAYLDCKQDFEQTVAKAIAMLATLNPDLAHLTPKDCCFRFYRDTRFSTDKSPYKRHFGAYICTKGKKALRGGTYIHLQPDNTLLAFGPWSLPTHILTACRNEILANTDEWRKAVESPEFLHTFGPPCTAPWDFDHAPARGFGAAMLKTAPKGFPRDSELIDYLRLKDYCCWVKIADDFFDSPHWEKPFLAYAKAAQPMVDFANSVIDDYE